MAKSSFLFFLILFLLAVLVQCEWRVVSRDLATALLGVAMKDDSTAWVVGDDNGVGPIVLQTTNGGQNWTNQLGQGLDALFLMAVTMDPYNHGFASGLGTIKVPGSVYTSDGETWNTSDTMHLISAFQSVGHTSEVSVWQVGTWATLPNPHGNGVQFSIDGGKNFIGVNWNQNTTARYGSFLSDQVGWIAGGEFPSSDNTNSRYVYPFNHHLSFVKRQPVFQRQPIEDPMKLEGHYVAAISTTTNGGQNWTSLYLKVGSKHNGFYFNGISFVNETTGWLVGEGVIQDSGAYAFIWGTNDGGKTWQEQLNVANGSLIQIRMVNGNEGWACGGIGVGSALQKGAFFRTSNGLNWTLDSSIPENYQLDVTSIGMDAGYSVGLNILGLSSVSKYFAI